MLKELLTVTFALSEEVSAALSLKQNVPAGDTDIKELREKLIKDGVML